MLLLFILLVRFDQLTLGMACIHVLVLGSWDDLVYLSIIVLLSMAVCFVYMFYISMLLAFLLSNFSLVYEYIRVVYGYPVVLSCVSFGVTNLCIIRSTHNILREGTDR